MQPERSPQPIPQEPEKQKIEVKDLDPDLCPGCSSSILQKQGTCNVCENCGFRACGLD